ncbi:MAG: glycoside hydrolase family 31 protein [Prevotella sp.]|nr:glycoside hydrolase family 31 protein [Prevotella sp.]MDY4039998.1 glycoside hydrolase family 31 protein [Prevotella sp.]
MKRLILLLTVALMALVMPAALWGHDGRPFVRVRNQVCLTLQDGLLSLEFVRPDIVRVRFTRENAFYGNGTPACLPRGEQPVAFTVDECGGSLNLRSDSLVVTLDLQTYALTFRDAVNGRLLLAERDRQPRWSERVVTERVTYDEATRRTVKTADGEKEEMDELRRDTVGTSWRYRNYFVWQPGEALYGLGSHMEDYLNLRGKTLYLVQHNLKEMIPVINSTAGYGLLFDAGCAMKYSDGREESYVELEAAREIDYYLMKGKSMDQVVAQMRRLTGDNPMLPRYMFGYIQSKERFSSSDDILSTLKEYRRRQVPIDLLVQDWNYWPKGCWGYMKMDRAFYPDPKSLADSVHALHARLMVSIWPNPKNSPQTTAFEQAGLMLPKNFYDAFDPRARRLYWQYAYDEFFRNGFDAWWCDCSEPNDGDWKVMPQGYGWNSQEQRWLCNRRSLGDVLGDERTSLYSIYHAMGIYENQRMTTDRKRVVNLTRSSFAGQQRYSTITWNGDTHASWDSFAQQIPSGLNFMAAGCPYWTVDVGSFFVGKKAQWFWAGDFPEGNKDLGYREYYTRMFQWGAFLPVFRSHGTDTRRMIWDFGKPGSMFYDALRQTIGLRYRLLPYIYSLAGRVTRDRYTMARLLAFDFPQDPNVLDRKDEYMFGPAFLVCPVTRPMYYGPGSRKLKGTRKTREVYLPGGTEWTDWWSGQRYDGGQIIQADAPISRMPLFVRAGSIIPVGPEVQYADQKTDQALTLMVYPGHDATFTLYEDAGDGYDYEQGAFAETPLSWDEQHRQLTIGDRKGSYEGMMSVRRIHIIKVGHDGRRTEKTVSYEGRKMTMTIE